MSHEIQVQRPYRHFKGNLYYVHSIVKHSETGEELVSYQMLYPPYDMYVRPLSMFKEKVEEGREDNVTNQVYRFELYTGK
ncbi:Uncharacterized protein conserved in bacteria [uncultured Clostridium sp.]|uniref:DUF1653 domain-containing protein n=1 Tax=Paeniclostridium hominis TaxID=2764329 RepID=UPI000821BCFC|nr:DUF1653 domain-containing protein [Paeniclostridium hominis]SCJ21336.1 Uncharacterized protein conserved in bacteria [uncultured Clostridium sp.]SCJ21479.1 Uncharacterized protein conserved in bacteria [uncultured Clostridium sp.]